MRIPKSRFLLPFAMNTFERTDSLQENPKKSGSASKAADKPALHARRPAKPRTRKTAENERDAAKGRHIAKSGERCAQDAPTDEARAAAAPQPPHDADSRDEACIFTTRSPNARPSDSP